MMTNDRSHFDESYRSADGYFGDEPERILVGHIRLIDPTRPALDIGTGQGRNALFLARKGITVDAIDPSGEAIRGTAAAARRNKLPVRSAQASFESFEPGGEDGLGGGFDTYGAICAFGLLPLLTWGAVARLQERVGEWSGPGTIVFVTAFTTDDPSHEVCRREWRSVGKNSFADETGGVRTFVEPGEGPRLFDAFEAVHHWEGRGPEHRHGDGPLQRHALVEMVLRR